MVRSYAAWVLKELGAAGAIPKLRSRLGRERDPRVKASLLEALAVLDDDDKCARRLESLLEHLDGNVRGDAANCLIGVADLSRRAQWDRIRRSLEKAVLAEPNQVVKRRLRQNLEILLED